MDLDHLLVAQSNPYGPACGVPLPSDDLGVEQIAEQTLGNRSFWVNDLYFRGLNVHGHVPAIALGQCLQSY